MNIVDRARRFVAKVNAAAVLLPDAEALTSVELFPKWEVGTIVESGLRVQYDVLLYRCVQSHTTQADWTPDITPALWVKVSIEEYP